MSARVCIHENPHAVWLASIHADITTLLCPLIPSFPFFFWAAWASGNDALKSEITALIQIRLLTDFLCSQKHSKVSFELPEGFSVTAEKWQLCSQKHSKVSFELPEGFSVTAEKWQQQGMFRVTQNISGYSRKPCRRVASPKSGNLFKPAVFLVYSLYFIPYSFILLYSVVRPMPSNAAAIVRLPFVCSSA